MVELGSRSYPVVVTDRGLLGLGAAVRSALPFTQRAIIVSNDTVWPLFGDAVVSSLSGAGIQVEHIIVPDGEAEKSIQRWENLVERMLDMGIDRHTPVVAVGGGVVGDLAGFTAATVLRGVPFVQVPTSLLGMVDSSVGGKTGVNTRHGKNLVGAFHQPSLVYASIDTLDHLPDAEFLAGLGEVLKHGIIADSVLFDRCRTEAPSILGRETAIIEDLVVRSIRIKAKVVKEDEREAGRRAVLNLGHTVGHAIEAVLMGTSNALPHGICIGIGLGAEVAWASARGVCTEETLQRVLEALNALKLPTTPPPIDPAEVLDAVMFDKKARRGTLRTPIVETIGQVRLTDIELVDRSELFHSLPGFS
jgi:3-dehydroquinate synthase